MADQFITNEKQLLSEVMDGIFPHAENLFFLVGFFYFSGFEEIYKNLEDKKLKILVGLDIEKDIINRVKEVELISEENISRGQLRSNFNTSLVHVFNETDFFDSAKKEEAFKIFISKVKDGSLEIRKTLKPNHSKLYLFERKTELSENGTYPGTLITGSSNLTASGLKHQYELNVILRNKADFEEGKRIFNELWLNAVVIADKDHITDFETEVIEKIWFEKLYKPYYVFIRVLHEYFSIEYDKNIKLPNEITKNKFLNLKYQSDSIKQALHTIGNHNGVIVADVVGLGKSVIASTVAHNLNLRTIIIAPPHLVKQWDDEYRDLFDFNAKVFSSGSIEKALEYFNENYNGEERLIIVDEAHKYRNEETQDYVNLHKLCQGNKVMLLTATPFNNKPQDIFSMVKLFQIPAKSTLKTVNNLGEEFTSLVKKYKKLTKAQKDKTKTDIEIKIELEHIAQQIRNIIAPLVIRRSRIDLKEIDVYNQDIKSQGIEFSKVNPPEILEYQLGEIESLYSDTLELISSEDEKTFFQGTRYKPVLYMKNIKKYQKRIENEFGDINLFRESQNNISKFMRHLLVRRFESSVFAFKSTLENMIKSSKNILNWYEKRESVPIFKKANLPDIEDYYNTRDDELSNEVKGLTFDEQIEKLTAKGLFEIPVQDIKLDFKKDLIKDIGILEDIHKRWFENGINNDPKLDSFSEILKQQIANEPKRKIVVFSEFSDTINYLFENLNSDIRLVKYTSKDASVHNKELLRLNFDAGVTKENQKDDFDILLATDAISEGYNLHRAGTIFNYDIPYNPTKVIQRVGRINRINKKVFDTLNIFNYFPTETGEFEMRTKEISTLKIAMIQALLGEDTKILTNDEELKSFYKKQYEQEIAKTEERSWENPYLNLYNSLKSANSSAFKEALKIPLRTRIGRSKKQAKKGVLVFGKKGNDFGSC
jgi:superfamily II DNA or RNA helicase